MLRLLLAVLLSSCAVYEDYPQAKPNTACVDGYRMRSNGPDNIWRTHVLNVFGEKILCTGDDKLELNIREPGKIGKNKLWRVD